MCSTNSLPCQKVPIVRLYVMNLNILPGDQDKKCTVIKHYMFDDDVPARISKQIIRVDCSRTRSLDLQPHSECCCK